MRAATVTGSTPTKRVRIEDVAETDTDFEIVEAALAFAGETRLTLFGTHLDRFGAVACVSLYTD